MWFVNLVKYTLMFIFGMAVLYTGLSIFMFWVLNHGSF